jgi:Sulfotransferase domain
MPPIRLAMWSGPRNISTALMRSWEARGDCAVIDEPLYARYLHITRVDHPMRDEIIRHGETDLQRIVRTLTPQAPVPGGQPIFYQKHMAHHVLPGDDTTWIEQLTNAFLIRNPRAMLISLSKVTPNPSVRDTGLPQQVALFQAEQARLGRTPPVIDSGDVLRDPARLLAKLCKAVGVEFSPKMLSWPAGPRATDGVWAKHWYAAVERSTGFDPPREQLEPLPAHLEDVCEACAVLYAQLAEHRLA